MLAHQLNSASYVVNNAVLSSGGFDCSDLQVSAFCSYSSNGSLPQNSNYYYTSVSTHCCVCAGACWHTNPPSYCTLHDPNQQIQNTPTWPTIPWTITPYPAGTGISSPGFTFTIEPEKCMICKDELTGEEVANDEKVCSGCRLAVETFKQVLVEEQEPTPRKRKKKK